MIRRYHVALATISLSLIGAGAGFADEPNFADLLARAHAQVAAGHQWAPAGDNVTETLEAMVHKLPEATPAQLADFDSLLRHTEESVDNRFGPAAGKSKNNNNNTAPVGGDRSVTPVTPPPQALTSTTTYPNVSSSNQERRLPPAPSEPADATGVASAPASPMPPSLTPQTAPSPASIPMPAKSQTAAIKEAPLPPPVDTTVSAAQYLMRGNEAEKRGDFSAARRYYTVAAQGGSAVAALALGRLYDPAFVRRNSIGGIDPDTATARRWYQRAVELGDTQASPLLETLSAR